MHTYKIWGKEDRLILGNNVHLNNAMINTVSGSIYIGDNTFLGHGVSLLTGTHDYRKTGLERQSEVPIDGRDIIIGKGVWIASNALIIGPCEIRDNSVIAANSVITGVIEEGCVVSTINEIKKKKIRFN
ncbi:transferase family hexapeptide repeat protein [Marinomonas foliarum]|uniref:Transferase family hexapeptide repeat protein n=1 Tax=Marinomonas foliarum TaxID=491950 RepID=A0A368ZYQ6_9GAMM|nr:transferase family hexapeptide repeat protein [Marinomonas foliarum]